jgi:hypothetical protein
MPCENCHTTTAWKPVRRQPEFNHNTQTSYPLLGMHEAVACQTCHVSLVFTKAPSRCADCHADLHQRQFGSKCEQCHTVRGWKVAVSALQQHNNRFPLLGAHAAATCDACHHGAATGVYTGLSTQCAACHLKDYQNARSLNHMAAKISTTCENCHNENVWQGARFDHGQATGFALTGAHADVSCAQCHQGNRFAGTPTACFGCHANDFTGTRNPNHVAAGFPQDCATCHTTLTWSAATFNHDTFTHFALTGAHVSVACSQCHVGGKFGGEPTTCEGCHLADFGRTTNPNHRTSGFSTSCDTCHTTTSWQNAKFNHSASRFPLTGAHVNVACAQCHLNGDFTNTPTQCSGCHLPDFQKTTNPSHVAGGFPQDCSMCHTTAGWTGATFNHAATGFALTGAHNSVQCSQCHTNNNFSLTSAACWNCHQTDFDKTTNPPHKASNFPQDCSVCHTTTNWDGATFNHTATGFTLTGAHTSLQCGQCHANNNFSLTGAACWNCHQTDFNNTANPPHKASNFPQDCSVCHTTTNWDGASFNHATTGFTLTGAHTSLQCGQCHANNNFSLTSGACWNCHQTDYNNTKDPNHKASNFPQDCSGCHTTTNWGGATFNHASTGFALAGVHATTQCSACHTNNNYSLTSAACWNCHQPDYNNANNPPHQSAGFPQDCTLCHGSSATNWTGATFNHTTTGFTLTGAHTSLQCAQCHVNNNYSLTSGACWNCHQADYNKTNDPPHKASNFPQDCSQCHTTTNWDGANFNHAATGFTLVGLHATAQCTACHISNNFSLNSTACWNCHQADYNKANSPPHQAAGFPQDCTLCHGSSASNWTSATFNHNTTGFTLTGAHTSLQCAQCHVNSNYSLTSGACWNCHQTDYNNTTDPGHKAANFPQDCSVCHTTTNWDGATFNHASTGFTLVGVHATTQCSACHISGNYSLTSAVCWNCHQTDYNNTNNPPHKTAGFPQDCTLCHGSSATNWTSATFNHTTTGFTLTGAHTALQCAQCHVNNNYSLTSGACWNCHQTDYNNTNNPPHKASNFPQDCSQCHTTTNWDGATFNHAATGFTLVGVHATTQCSACHINNNYSLTSAVCWNCHQTDYNNTNNPPHLAAGFPQDCTLCHGSSATNWTSATFNHATTGFALTGAHLSLQCAQCHVNNNYSLTSGACWNCHQTDYNNTNNPPHKTAGFPQDCSQCHTTTNWNGATFNHTTTGFALVGMHATAQCSACHINNNYSLTSAVCWNCHQTDYNNTNNPPHLAAGFPQDCTLCHGSSATNWTSATFNHATTGFTLTGAHLTLQCAQCHVNNNYSLTSGACWNCHQTDYNNTNNPPHLAAGFPQDCSMCHTTTDWTGATFNHATTGFTLTGAHLTLQCNQCHVNNNYSLTSGACWNCHQADYNGTTNPPHLAAGFPQDCSTCHSTTDWSGATFNHPTTPLQLTGYHATMLANNQCNLCHVNNSYTNTPSDCWSCHQTDYNNTTNPNHAAAGFAHTCDSCHTFVDWTGAQYLAHDSAYFPIYSGTHKNAWTQCSDCHTNSSNYAVFTCIVCHQHSNQQQVTSDHQGVKGFVYNGTSCYGCHPKGTGGG